MRRISPALVLAALAVAFSTVCIATPAWPWGCEGHQTIALIAQQHLTPHARRTVTDLLEPSPIDPRRERFCQSRGMPAIAAVSTWADDVRGDDRSPFYGTGRWHFIDIPRGVSAGDLSRYCAHGGCVITALRDQLTVLRAAAGSQRARAEALMLVIHLIGDLHQPLHCATNNDAGANCVPVTYFDDVPRRSRAHRGVYEPNLHAVWDRNIIRDIVGHRGATWFAESLDRRFRSQTAAWQQAPIDFEGWAWESHAAAERTAYGELPAAIATEPPRRAVSCASTSKRLLRLHERLGEGYEQRAIPVVEEQLAKAGVRLAMVLNQLWP